MLGHLARDGYQIVDAPEDAEIIVVNTCGFIDAAKEESIDVILDMAQYKVDGRCKKLVVAGCLSQRYAPELAEEIPEVDHFLGTGNFDSIAEVVGSGRTLRTKRRRLPVVGEVASSHVGHQRERGDYRPRLVGRSPYRHEPKPGARHPVAIPDPDFTITADSPRIQTMAPHSVYVKVSEGCSNTCAFCVIPAIRGPQRSRPIADVVAEVERLADRGAVEINLVAQDLCAYGKDRSKESLAQLLAALNSVGEQVTRPFWIRCLYAYPKGLTREVMEVMASSLHVLPYLDIPLQHISDRILRRMRRGKGGTATRELIHRLRLKIPGLTLRTSLITGLPGETDADFRELCDFVEEVRFEHMGVFTYSPEEDTPAAEMSGQVDPELALERRTVLMEIQRRISAEQQRAFLGRTIDVLVDGVSDETELLLQGRHSGQAPDIDGLTYINDGTASPGQVVRVFVDQSHDYDLVGGIVPAGENRPRRRGSSESAQPGWVRPEAPGRVNA
jgi:ribosomal protein S12 methylthiotransferase